MAKLIVSLLALLCLLQSLNAEDLLEDFGQSRIIGGKPARKNQIPYQALLTFFAVPFCGAAIISPTVVLTAAHCIEDKLQTMLGNIRVYVGIVDISELKLSDSKKVKNISIHPEYEKTAEYDYDIAIIQLEEPLKFDDAVQPIKLATKYPTTGEMATVSGWGMTEDGVRSFFSNILLYTNVPIRPIELCKNLFNEERFIQVTNRMICAGGEVGKDACLRDSGGPLVVNNTLVGLVSWGIHCGRNYPALYTNLIDPEIKEFIDKHL